MKPTIGRIVHYHDSSTQHVHAAIVTAVHDNGTVDLTIFRPRGEMADAREGSAGGLDGTASASGCWTWPPRA